MSGDGSPAYAVSSFSWAAVNGIFCTFTSMSGCSRSKPWINVAATSPSRPTPQNLICFLPEERPHPLSAIAAPDMERIASRRFMTSSAGWRGHGLIEPAAREGCALQAVTDVRIFGNDAPDHPAALIFDHCDNGPLAEAEISLRHPADVFNDAAVAQ